MKVLIVDDDAMICSSLNIILSADPEIEVVGTENDGEAAIITYERETPDVLLMDIRMEHMNGLDAGKKILSEHPEARILYLTTFLDDDYIIRALNIGAKGYMMKQDFESIVPSVKAVYSGQNVYGNEIVEKLPVLLSPKKEHETYEKYGINQKEYDIICHIAEGYSNKEISELLLLGEGTIRNYISQILEKLGLRDRTQIAIFYYKNKNGQEF